jgi:hypothetical protein
MSELPEVLTRKIGPLPAGAWAAAILGGLGVSYFLRHRGSAAASASPDTTMADTVAPTDAPTGGTGGASMSLPGNISPAVDTGAPDMEAFTISTNAEWRQQAVKWLVGNGVGAISAEQAVANYLSGGTLTAEQANNINRAVAAIGPAPDAVPSISVAGPDIPAEPGPPTHHPAAKHHKPKPHHATHKPAANHTHHAAPKHHPKDTGKHTHPRRH